MKVFAMGNTNLSALWETVVEIPNMTWDNIRGLEEVKKELVQVSTYICYQCRCCLLASTW